MVCLGVRLRRRAVSAGGVRADLRRAHPGRGRARNVRGPQSEPGRSHRLRCHAAGHGRYSGCGPRPRTPTGVRRRGATPPASLFCNWRGSACCGYPICGARDSWSFGARTDGAGVGRTHDADHVAPPAHRRALWVAHSHRAGRIDPGGHPRGAGRARLGRSPRAALADHRRRAVDRVLDVVDVPSIARCTICSPV